MRRRRNAEAAELVVRRAELLQPRDRALLRAIYADGLSISQVALLRSGYDAAPDAPAARDAHGSGTEPPRHAADRGRAPASARRTRSRVKALVERVLSPTFVFVASRQGGWTPTRRRVAQAVFLHGLTLREASAALGVSLHVVRRHADAVRTLAEEREPRGR